VKIRFRTSGWFPIGDRSRSGADHRATARGTGIDPGAIALLREGFSAVRPLLKWAGGKARLARQIDFAFVEGCRGTYFEPFVGSAAVYLYRRAHGRIRDAVLSDVNHKLVALHRAVRDDVEGVIAELARLPIEDWRERYYEVRDAFNQGPHDGAAHAARFVWLNRAGFNGLYRENRHGSFNVPLGKYARLAVPDPEHFREVSALLQGVEIVTAGFRETLARAGQGDQVYCDPPYVPLSGTSNFTAYASSPFALREQRLLSDAARAAAESGARVVLSNHDLPIVREELYAPSLGYSFFAAPRVSRAISNKGSSRGSVAEVIAAIGPRARRPAA
jgi:DNA adenine methylase